jgi:hypothetical protein
MKSSYRKYRQTFTEKLFNGLDHLTQIQKNTKLKIEAIVIIEILQILYYIFLPRVRIFKIILKLILLLGNCIMDFSRIRRTKKVFIIYNKVINDYSFDKLFEFHDVWFFVSILFHNTNKCIIAFDLLCLQNK